MYALFNYPMRCYSIIQAINCVECSAYQTALLIILTVYSTNCLVHMDLIFEKESILVQVHWYCAPD